MRVSLNIFAFYLAFTVNVQVKAENQEFKTVPEKCWSEQRFPCVVKAQSELAQLKTENFKAFFSKDTIIQIDSDKSMTLISGRIWLGNRGDTLVKYLAGEATLAGGIIEIEFNKEKTFFRPITAAATLAPIGHTSEVKVPMGYENEVMKVDRTGKSVVGVPRAADLKQVLHGAGLFFRKNKKQFASEMKTYHRVWQDAVENSSRMNRYIASREVKRAKEEEQIWLERKKKQEVERQNLRNKFWNKVFQ